MLQRVIIVLLFFVCGNAYSQLKIYPIQKVASQNQNIKIKNGDKLRTQSSHLTLPFWEDFSKSDGIPAETVWDQSTNVFVSPGLGLNPPSINVASFDGLKVDGTGYSGIAQSEGPTDALTSFAFDLSIYQGSDNIFLSFFYQYAGNGDDPELSDSIRLEFMNVDMEWVTVWPRNGEGLNRTGEFDQIILPVTQSEFLHPEFKFKFQSFGRQSGPFDTWNVDYIYMNEQRGVNDLFYPDRTITTPLSSIFSNYTSIPKNHFDGSLSRGDFRLSNLDDGFAQPYDFDLSFLVTNYLDGTIISSNTYAQTNIEPTLPSSLSPINPGATDTVFIPQIIPVNEFNVLADSTFVTYEVILDSDDEIDDEPIVSIIDFTVNDTIRGAYELKDYYAYDDGTAEVGAGLNFSGRRLAYQFEKLGDTLNYIHGFDIYFPYLNTSPNGKTIYLSIWGDDNGQPGNLLYEERIAISTQPGLNTFTRFNLSAPTLIENPVFYIGYKQGTAGDLAVGMDRNTDTSNKIFFNLSGTWEQDADIPGSLMMRPVFGPEPEEITSVEPVINETARVYPNPTFGQITIDKRVKHVAVFNLNGSKEEVSVENKNSSVSIDLSTLPAGIYILKYIDQNNPVIQKIIKR